MTGTLRAYLAAIALAAIAAAAIAAAGCTPAPGTAATAPAQQDAVLRFACDVADAELWVNDRFVAPIGRLSKGIALSPGSHRIEVRHDGYHTHYEEVTVTPRQRRTVTVELAEILP
jgi:hypothetical protein